MRVTDRIYGSWDIDEPVLLALLATPSLLRLKGIAQYGIPDKYYHKQNYSRYDHSLGVMLFLRRLKASLEEQIAGLLHDVSHTAFSHAIDWVIGEGKTENFQDENHRDYFLKSEIPRILNAHGFETEVILDYHHFGLLEREAPNLCADRIDYSLREMPEKISPWLLSGFVVRNGYIVFKDRKRALRFGREYLKLQMTHWGGFEAVARYRLFANVLRRAMDMRLITLDDFWQDDTYVLRKITASLEISKLLQPLTEKSLAHLPKSQVVVHKKFRSVDPLFIDAGCLRRASEVDRVYAGNLEAAKKENALGVQIPNV